MNIKELRAASGMSQSEFAKYFGIPKDSLQNWEQGRRKCPEYLLNLIEYKLNAETKKEEILKEYIEIVKSFQDAEETVIFRRSTKIAQDLKELEEECEKYVEDFKMLMNK